MRYAALSERKLRKFLFHCLKLVVGPMVGTDIFMDRLSASLSKPVASWAACNDHRVDGWATVATGGVTTALSRRGMPVTEGRRWSIWKGRVAGHRGRRAVRVRAATGGGDVVRRRLREKRSEGREGIPCGRVWRRWWELFHGQLVGRGFAVRIVAAVCDRGVANRSCSDSYSVGRLRVQPSVGEERSLCVRGVAKRAH
jgi:hypothetical protein